MCAFILHTLFPRFLIVLHIFARSKASPFFQLYLIHRSMDGARLCDDLEVDGAWAADSDSGDSEQEEVEEDEDADDEDAAGRPKLCCFLGGGLDAQELFCTLGGG